MKTLFHTSFTALRAVRTCPLLQTQPAFLCGDIRTQHTHTTFTRTAKYILSARNIVTRNGHANSSTRNAQQCTVRQCVSKLFHIKQAPFLPPHTHTQTHQQWLVLDASEARCDACDIENPSATVVVCVKAVHVPGRPAWHGIASLAPLTTHSRRQLQTTASPNANAPCQRTISTSPPK